jgi:hypothetical protein
MSDPTLRKALIESGLLGKLIVKRRHIWQLDLLSAEKLNAFARERGVDFLHNSFDSHTRGTTGPRFIDPVRYFWELGLLRADLVVSRTKLRKATGLAYIGRDDDRRYLYSDSRKPITNKAHPETMPDVVRGSVVPLFHPFRYYVLLNLRKELSLGIFPIQLLIKSEAYPQMLGESIDRSRKRLASQAFADDIQRWNDATDLAVVAEPCVFTYVFGSLRLASSISESLMWEHINEHRLIVNTLMQQLDGQEVEVVCNSLCSSAHELDPNTQIHILLRLSEGETRWSLEGALGGSICLLTMAEMIRRVAEDAFDIDLPEEDEQERGVSRDFKARRYGADRILDGDPTVGREYLRSLGFDYGVRLRWYVEGETEYGAFNSVFENSRAVQLINLKGLFIESGGKGIQFGENLLKDRDAGIFSWISLDEGPIDKTSSTSHFLRIVLGKIRETHKYEPTQEEWSDPQNRPICGMMWVAYPDFEFSNFDLDELEEILWNIAVENHAEPGDRVKLHRAIKSCDNAKDLIARAQTLEALKNSLRKGKGWGKRLMDYAEAHPRRRVTGIRRPMLQAMDAAQAIDLFSYRGHQEDPDHRFVIRYEGSEHEFSLAVDSHFRDGKSVLSWELLREMRSKHKDHCMTHGQILENLRNFRNAGRCTLLEPVAHSNLPPGAVIAEPTLGEQERLRKKRTPVPLE